jgi:NAD-dependent dihydropyrimidine dehydrogenase PreA subunit
MIPEVVIRDNPGECIRCYRCASPPCEKEYEIATEENWCKDCGICAEFCPEGALKRAPGGPPEMADSKACTGFSQCMVRCPELGLKIREKQPASSEEVNDAS